LKSGMAQRLFWQQLKNHCLGVSEYQGRSVVVGVVPLPLCTLPLWLLLLLLSLAMESPRPRLLMLLLLELSLFASCLAVVELVWALRRSM